MELIPRDRNQGADALAKLGSKREAMLLSVIPLELQAMPSMSENFAMEIVTSQPTWMTPICDYIKT